MTDKPDIPLVRLSLILPFVQELDRRKVNSDAVLMANGLMRETVLDTDVFVPAIVVHRFLENAAEVANDPYLGINVGESLNLAQWPPFVDAVSRSTTLMDFLVRFICAAKEEASSSRHTLDVGGNYSFFREIRVSEQEIAPAQNDAFTTAYLLNLLRRGAGSSWFGRDVLVKVCDPGVVPERYLDVDIVSGDRMGVFLRFPTTWLLQPLDKNSMIQLSSTNTGRLHLPTEFIDCLRLILGLHLDEADLKVDQIARLLGTSRQSLQRKLKTNGTTLTAEVTELKKQRTAHDLTHSAKTVVEIATSVGFRNPTSFTRAFKSWTGQSPQQYRKSHRSQ